MNTVLWTLQILLAVIFAGAGTVKLIQSREWLAETLGDWITGIPVPQIRLLGAAELLGAIGLILPPLVGVASWLTPLAACGLVVVMIGAVATHAGRREYPNVAINVLLAAMAVVVAWGRFGPHAF